MVTLAQLHEIEHLRSVRTRFATFFKEAWNVFEPSVELRWNWHVATIRKNWYNKNDQVVSHLLGGMDM